MIQVGIGLNAKLWQSGLESIKAASGRAVGTIGGQWRSLALGYLGVRGVQLLTKIASEWNDLGREANLSVDTMARLEAAARAAGLSVQDIRPLFQGMIDDETLRKLDLASEHFERVAASGQQLATTAGWRAIFEGARNIGQKFLDTAMLPVAGIGMLATRFGAQPLQTGRDVKSLKPLIEAMNSEKSKGGSRGGAGIGVGLNPLQQIGGFSRGPTDRIVNYLRNIDGNTKATAQALGQRNAGVGAIGF